MSVHLNTAFSVCTLNFVVHFLVYISSHLLICALLVSLCVQELYNCPKKVPRDWNVAKYIEVWCTQGLMTSHFFCSLKDLLCNHWLCYISMNILVYFSPMTSCLVHTHGSIHFLPCCCFTSLTLFSRCPPDSSFSVATAYEHLLKTIQWHTPMCTDTPGAPELVLQVPWPRDQCWKQNLCILLRASCRSSDSAIILA